MGLLYGKISSTRVTDGQTDRRAIAYARYSI